jgi:prevent-host-death family protein
VTVEEAREKLSELMDEVNREGSTVIIGDKQGGEVAMIPAAELASLLEVDHLTQSPENARRLFQALANALRSKG